MARFANEFGMTSLPSYVGQGAEDCAVGGDDAEEERDDIVNNMENASVSSRPPVDGLLIHHDRPTSPEVCSVT